MNNVVLIGRLCRDPELKYLPGDKNTAVAKFTLAVDRLLSKEKKAEMQERNQQQILLISLYGENKLKVQ